MEEGIRGPARARRAPAYDEEIDALLLHRLKCNTYAMFKKLLDGLEAKGALPAAERDRYLAEIAKMTCEAGGTCAFIGTGQHGQGRAARPGLRAARGRPPHQGRPGDDVVAHRGERAARRGAQPARGAQRLRAGCART